MLWEEIAGSQYDPLTITTTTEEGVSVPTSTKKQIEMSLRRAIEWILFTLGMTRQDVAFALGLQASTIQRDFEELGGKDRFPYTGEHGLDRRDSVYTHSLWMYRKILAMTTRQRWEELRTNHPEWILLEHDPSVIIGVRDAIATYADVKRLTNMADGIGSMRDALLLPSDPPEYLPYRRLLNVIFRCHYGQHVGLGKILLCDYLEQTETDKTILQRDTIDSTMARWAVRNAEPLFLPPLTAGGKAAMDKVVGELPPRLAYLIQMRFGLGTHAETSLDDIGGKLGVNKERVRQLEARALRLLRDQKVKTRLNILVTPPTVTVAKIIDKIFLRPAPAPHSESVEIDRMLTRPLDQIEEFFSVRTEGILVRAGLGTILGIVQKTEAELLLTPNISHRIVIQVKEALHRIGLCLGMTVVGDQLVFPAGHEEQ